MRAVVGRIEDDGIVGDTEIVDRLQQLADIVVVLQHSIEIFADAAAAPHGFTHMGVEVHPCRVPPAEERFVRLNFPLDKIDGGV